MKKSNIVEEPQLRFETHLPKIKKGKSPNKIEMISLFSGCGGMDLGFEGGFSVLQSSINEILTPHFIDKKLKNGFVQLKKTKFKTVFANDIFTDARNAWVNYFSKRGHNAEDFYKESIVDLVKMYRNGVNVFPEDDDPPHAAREIAVIRRVTIRFIYESYTTDEWATGL